MNDQGMNDQGMNPVEEAPVRAECAGMSADLARVSYAMFALQQPIGLEDLKSADEYGHLRSQHSQAPMWFAAAANDSASLLDTAPELLAGLGIGSESQATVVPSDSDIIGIYAPETRRESPEPAATPTPSVAASQEAPEGANTPRTSIQMGLLRELADLDL